MSKLGDTLWNFEELRMSFIQDASRRILQGQKGNEFSVIGCNKMQKLLEGNFKLTSISLIQRNNVTGFFMLQAKEGSTTFP